MRPFLGPHLLMNFQPSPFEKHLFLNRSIYLKRDDLLDTHFSGNKARKFAYYLTHDFPHIKRVISYGSNQSNAMYSLSVLAKMKGWEFWYVCDHIPQFLKENPCGNYAEALKNGMSVFESSSREAYAKGLVDDVSMLVCEGGHQQEAHVGLQQLALELRGDIATHRLEKPIIFLPSGTGTTAFFLQQCLPYPIFTCPTVGDSDYLQQQWKELSTSSEDTFPTILPSSKKFHYGKLYPELYALWLRLKEEMGVTFDLVYDPVGWSVLLEHINALQGDLIYIHQGGILGNASMVERYERKANML